MSNGLKVGGNVDGWCTKCKLILAHTIEVLAGSEIKRVSCNTCHGKHQFKAHPPGTHKASKTSGVTPRVNNYAALLESHQDAKALPYSFQAKYFQGSVLNHTTFGLGIVTADKGGNKIEVLFPAGSKVLVHCQA